MPSRKPLPAVLPWLTALTAAPLVLIVAAVAATRFGGLDVGVAHDLLTWTVARILAWVGLAAALVATLLTLRDIKGRGLYAGIALALAGATVGGFLWQAARHEAETPRDVTSNPADAPVFSRLAAFHRGSTPAGPDACPAAVSIPTQVLAQQAASALVDAGWSLTKIGVVSGAIASAPAVLSALGAGALVSRWGRRRVLVLGGVLLAVATLGLVPLALGEASTVWTTIALCAFMAAYAVANVVVYTINMDFARPDSAGTDFTTLTSFALAISFVAAALALTAAVWIGYLGVLVASIVLDLVCTALGLRHQRRHGVS